MFVLCFGFGKMSSVLIFIPNRVYEETSCHLFGTVFLSKNEKIYSFYILHFLSTKGDKKDESFGHKYVGYYGTSFNSIDDELENKTWNWLVLGNKNEQIILSRIMIEGSIINISPQNVIFLTYDLQNFVCAELLFAKYSSKETGKGNYLQTLVSTIESDKRMSKTIEDQGIHSLLLLLLVKINFLLNNFLNRTIFLLPAIKYSSLCLRVHNSLRSLTWVLNDYTTSERLGLKTGNYISAVFLDVSFGYLILFWFMAMSAATLPSQLLLNTAEDVVETLQELLKWLMGIPAGLKLNFAFNNMLGKFFLYHINLWWTFLVLAEPMLNLMFIIFLWFGRLGLSFQAAILADLLALVSFHIYCIYVYAARLYNLQISGLLALWRLFLGRKKNPLRGRVDSCQYTANQLFIGTLAFTILLFLLPTTLMYYVVFTTLRLLVAALAGLLIRVQFLLQMIPLYASVLWLFKSTSINSTLNIKLQRRKVGLLIDDQRLC